MKIINSILASKDKFLFSDVDVQNSTGTEVYNAATVKAMNPKELSIFLQDKCQGVSAETIVYLLNEDVDGESFLEFTDQSLLSNFPGLSCDQRMSILRVVSNAGDAQYETTFHFANHNVIEIPLQEDLGCGVLQGFVDEGGILKAVTGETSQKVDWLLVLVVLSSRRESKTAVLLGNDLRLILKMFVLVYVFTAVHYIYGVL
ncbi:Glutamate--tRNA ligase [Frankliniella fusca]|uniref:Glutamate--tRNA ligase n=1 Tax=Frankliniella fusca TaxID=407009 RepID=A0AAE1H721_9NEOP|nr:Glutamate--tRNA ligase [Frankliniella fusca]